MFIPRKLQNPPIREAIFSITFKDAIAQENLNLFLQSDFSKTFIINSTPSFSVNITPSKNQPNVVTTNKIEGFVLKPKDGKNRLIHIRPTFISYHNLEKYDGWDIMINELKELWSEFCKSIGTPHPSEVKVRNINQILLPLPFQLGFKEYIKLLPSVPEGINPIVDNFFIQINTSNKEKKLNAVISEKILKVDKTKAELSLLLDVTVFKKSSFECDKKEMWDSFTDLREYKDDLFFNCITKKTEDLFNG
jgi:uncharacterized protein (TIGR04255 family)